MVQLMKILFLSAFPPELQSLKNLLSNTQRQLDKVGGLSYEYQTYKNHDIYFSYTGIGTAAAGLVLASLTQHLQPDLVVFIGTAGGVANHLKIGDLIIASEVVDIDIYNLHDAVKNTPFESSLINPHTQKPIPQVYAGNYILKQAINISPSMNINLFIDRIGTTNYFPSPTFMFDTIKKLNITAIDMESAVFYQASWLLGINTLVIRAVSNLLDSKGDDPNIHESNVSLCADNLASYSRQLLDNLTAASHHS